MGTQMALEITRFASPDPGKCQAAARERFLCEARRAWAGPATARLPEYRRSRPTVKNAACAV
jgi:hypothetical protein